MSADDLIERLANPQPVPAVPYAPCEPGTLRERMEYLSAMRQLYRDHAVPFDL